MQRLDATGGEVSVDATAGYDDLERWRRAVKWTTDTVEVRDDVALAGAKTGQILFRWHLGTRHPVEVSGQDGKWQVSWPDATMAIESATALVTASLTVLGSLGLWRRKSPRFHQ